MQSSLISKIEKARRYAAEPHRMHVDRLQVTFHGDNGDHEVSIENDTWHCSCDFFEGWNVCSHTMALERLMAGMVPEQPLGSTAAAPA
jgi:hypothetical protein